MKFKPVVIEKLRGSAERLLLRPLRRLSPPTYRAWLPSRASRAPKPGDHVILPEVISKEPLGPVVRHGDDHWFDIVRWSLFAMIEAEEMGLTSKNIDQQAASKDPGVQRFLGATGDIGKMLGLDNQLGLQHRQAGRQLRRELRAQSQAARLRRAA